MSRMTTNLTKVGGEGEIDQLTGSRKSIVDCAATEFL